MSAKIKLSCLSVFLVSGYSLAMAHFAYINKSLKVFLSFSELQSLGSELIVIIFIAALLSFCCYLTFDNNSVKLKIPKLNTTKVSDIDELNRILAADFNDLPEKLVFENNQGLIVFRKFEKGLYVCTNLFSSYNDSWKEVATKFNISLLDNNQYNQNKHIMYTQDIRLINNFLNNDEAFECLREDDSIWLVVSNAFDSKEEVGDAVTYERFKRSYKAKVWGVIDQLVNKQITIEKFKDAWSFYKDEALVKIYEDAQLLLNEQISVSQVLKCYKNKEFLLEEIITYLVKLDNNELGTAINNFRDNNKLDVAINNLRN